MRAIRQYEFGPASVLRHEEVPDPEPAAGQVLVDVAAAGVHLVDTSLRRGSYGGPFPLPTLPMTPGREVAGVVAALGPGADASWLGRRVVAHLGTANGGYASRAVAPVSALHLVPSGVDEGVAVAAIGTGRTTLAVLDQASLTAADTVLVTAAAGGMGSLVVQAGLRAGATVVGLAGGPDKAAAVRAAGAHVAVDYLDPTWPTAVRAALADLPPPAPIPTSPGPSPAAAAGGPAGSAGGAGSVSGTRRVGVTVVLDGVGGEAGRAALELLVPGGRYLMHGFSSGTPSALSAGDLYSLGITASAAIGPAMFHRWPNGFRELETRALAEAAAGHLVPVVGHRFPLAEAAAAHTALESRATTGKVILVP